MRAAPSVDDPMPLNDENYLGSLSEDEVIAISLVLPKPFAFHTVGERHIELRKWTQSRPAYELPSVSNSKQKRKRRLHSAD
jgi:hypothetical protein